MVGHEEDGALVLGVDGWVVVDLERERLLRLAVCWRGARVRREADQPLALRGLYVVVVLSAERRGEQSREKIGG